jgi:hypothetical protein
MKPTPDVSGTPFNFDAIPMWLYPDVWDEAQQVRLRGLWFVLLYVLSTLFFTEVIALILALVFSKSIVVMAVWGVGFGILGGVLIGLSAWFDFVHRRKKLLVENIDLDAMPRKVPASPSPKRKMIISILIYASLILGGLFLVGIIKSYVDRSYPPEISAKTATENNPNDAPNPYTSLINSGGNNTIGGIPISSPSPTNPNRAK